MSGSPSILRVLDEGTFCHVAASTPGGPHVTPMVFTAVDGSVWVTTSRGSAKARAWKRDPKVAGLVRLGAEAVAFTGSATMFDLLDPGTWTRSFVSSPALTRASVRFTRKNGRFFAGYAVDAHRVPLAWTPPGRVFVELRVERAALIDAEGVRERTGEWGRDATSTDAFRAARAGSPAFARLPADVREGLGERGRGALALGTGAGVVVVPASWLLEGPSIYAVLPTEVVAIAGAPAEVPASLTIDLPSSWRASEMVGAMVRGTAAVAIVDRLSVGERSAVRIARAAGAEPGEAAVVTLRPRSLVWWRGWSSGTIAA